MTSESWIVIFGWLRFILTWDKQFKNTVTMNKKIISLLMCTDPNKYNLFYKYKFREVTIDTKLVENV